MRILVTGAGGFIARHVLLELTAGSGTTEGHEIIASLRTAESALTAPSLPGVAYKISGEIHGETDWRALLQGVEVVIHTAARVHRDRRVAGRGGEAYQNVNVEGTITLARQAAAAGVRRLVFLSSLAAESTALALASGQPKHVTAYGLSKLQAEDGLAAVARETGLEVVCLRPPLVYGPGAPGAFSRLLLAVRWGLPLPFASIENRRSLLFVGNLAQAVVSTLSHPRAPGAVLALSDGTPLSTPDLVRHLAAALGRKPLLWPCPPRLLRTLGWLSGQSRLMQSLLDSSVIDDEAIQERLGWQAQIGLTQAFRLSVKRGPPRS